MPRLSILITILFLVSSSLISQPVLFEEFPDAIPYNLKAPTNLYLTNQGTETVKSYFIQPGHPQPKQILKVDEGYYHGYRLCYEPGDCMVSGRSTQWIQIVTIDTEECIEWLEKYNLEALWFPFRGIKELSYRSGHNEADFNSIFEQYKHLACRLYRQTENNEGLSTNEMALILEKYSQKMKAETNQMLASKEVRMLVKPISNEDNDWSLWIQCFEELDLVGYITLIEYSGMTVSSLPE